MIKSACVASSASNRKWGGVDVVTYDPDAVLVNNPEGTGRPQAICWRPALARLVQCPVERAVHLRQAVIVLRDEATQVSVVLVVGLALVLAVAAGCSLLVEEQRALRTIPGTIHLHPGPQALRIPGAGPLHQHGRRLGTDTAASSCTTCSPGPFRYLAALL